MFNIKFLYMQTGSVLDLSPNTDPGPSKAPESETLPFLIFKKYSMVPILDDNPEHVASA